MERVTARYLIETPHAVDAAAAALAGEQSSGTFVAVPGETEELMARFAARLESCTPCGESDRPGLPGTAEGEGVYRRAEVEISWPLENCGYNLPTLISMMQGNLYELRQLSGIRLLDFDPPPSFADQFTGPRHGVSGTRRLAGVEDRPLIGTIIKPSVGLTPEQTAELVGVLAGAGIDFIKDDELMADPSYSPVARRVEAVMRVINDHADRTGKKVMYAFNISDEINRMQHHYDTVLRHGGTCVMVSLNTVGTVGVKRVCDRGALAVHGHRNGWGMMTRYPLLGMDFTAYQKLWRLAGVDQIHVNGLANKFWEPDESVVRSIRACREPLLGGFEIMPVISSGQWGGQAPETYRQTQTADMLYLCGGGILAHPDGPAQGVQAVRDAWSAAIEGLTLDEAEEGSPALRRASQRFRKGPAPVASSHGGAVR